jgi:hypothetical protein
MIAFDAYAADCLLFGKLALGDGRLTELLNASSALPIADARLESLIDGQQTLDRELSVDLAELYAVVAAGSRGDPARRVRTRTIIVVVRLGPYSVTGAIHGAPASNPLVAVLRRPPWIPLTRASITYLRGPETTTDEVGTLIINRNLASSLHAQDEDAERLLWDGAGIPPSPDGDEIEPSEVGIDPDEDDHG